MLGKLGLVAGTAVSVLGSPAQAAAIHQTTTYFAVHGSTLEELDSDLDRSGPLVVDTGMRHPGATEVKFDGNVTYKRVRAGCKVAKPNLTLSLKVMLPKWDAPRTASARTRIVWQVLERDIRQHELTHVAIAKRWLARTELALRNLSPRPDCEAMRAVVEETTRRYLAGHEAAQQNFDRLEAQRVDLRLHRKVAAALRKARR